MKKILSLALCMAFFVHAGAATVTVEGITYTLNNDGTAKLTSGKGCTGDIVIPDIVGTGTPGTVNYKTYRVTSIGNNAFLNCTGITSVRMPESVNMIYDYAFKWCTNLKTINFPEELTKLWCGVFYGCSSLDSIALNPRCAIILDDCFYGCTSLKNVVLSDSLEFLGTECFRGCMGLTSLTIPDCARQIGDGAFWGCTGLKSVHIPESMQIMGEYVFRGCTSLEGIYIPARVRHIGKRAFQECTSLKEINVDEANGTLVSVDGVLYVNIYLMAYPCAKPETSLVIPEGIRIVGPGACYKAVNLKSVTFPSSMKKIEEDAFTGCKRIKTVITNDSLTYIGARAFEDCIRLESFNIPEGVELIGDWAFSNCGLLSVTLPSTVATIGRGVFSNCGNLLSAVINSPTVGESNFNGCYSLESVTWGSGVNTIGGFAFGGCAMTTIDIPEGVTSIGIQAFQSCKQLTTVTIPKSMTSLGTMVFRECSALDTVVCKVRTPIALSGEYFSGLPLATATLYVPRGSKSLYEAATGWNEFTSIVELPGITGDINNDDMVDVSDVSAVVDYILGSGIYTAAECDVNGDGAVDVGDVSALIDIILQ